MVNAFTEKTVIIVLELSVEEAKYIRDFCQNHPYDFNEDTKQRRIREALFTNLRELHLEEEQ